MLTQTQNARGFEQLRAAQAGDDMELTQDDAPQPELDVSSTLLRKADEIFQKEQEQIALQQQEELAAEKLKSPEMFINESGWVQCLPNPPNADVCLAGFLRRRVRRMSVLCT